MAITIRNKTTEELIRKIGRRTGEGPSAIVTRLVKAEFAGRNGRKVPEEEVRRRMEEFEALARKFPPPHPAVAWEEMERDVDALYDYLDVDDDGIAKPDARR